MRKQAAAKQLTSTVWHYLEHLRLSLGNEYNLNNVKEIKVTDDFLTLDKTVIECQNDKSYTDCTTNLFIDSLLKYCKCLPFGMKNEENVSNNPAYCGKN